MFNVVATLSRSKRCSSMQVECASRQGQERNGTFTLCRSLCFLICFCKCVFFLRPVFLKNHWHCEPDKDIDWALTKLRSLGCVQQLAWQRHWPSPLESCLMLLLWSSLMNLQTPSLLTVSLFLLQTHVQTHTSTWKCPTQAFSNLLLRLATTLLCSSIRSLESSAALQKGTWSHCISQTVMLMLQWSVALMFPPRGLARCSNGACGS